MFRSWPGRSQTHAGIPLEPLSDWRACCGALLTMLRVVGEFKDLGYRAMLINASESWLQARIEFWLHSLG